jgi:CubicO group peptidase (beta-lactamase class C family)
MSNRTRKNRYELRKKYRRRRLIAFFSTLIILLAALFVGISWWVAKEKVAEPVTPKATAKKEPKQVEKPKQPEQTKEIVRNQEIDTYLKQIGFSGTAVVVREGNTVLNKGYRDANRITHVKNTPDTVYYIGSAQKAFIATAILQLEEKGKVKVTDSVQKYLPEFEAHITLNDLLHHTSGLVGHTEENVATTPKALVADIIKQGTKRGPGKWDYLDSNYTVLAYLVEKLSGESLSEYLKENIFKPAGMKTVGFYQTFKKEKGASVGYYIKKDGSYSEPSLPDLSQLFGVGNMYMSAFDMYLFDKALSSRKILSENSFQKMFTKGSSSGYGMGFYVDPGSYNNHGILNGWNVSNSMSHTGKTYVVLFSNIQNNIDSFGKVNNHIYEILNK